MKVHVYRDRDGNWIASHAEHNAYGTSYVHDVVVKHGDPMRDFTGENAQEAEAAARRKYPDADVDLYERPEFVRMRELDRKIAKRPVKADPFAAFPGGAR